MKLGFERGPSKLLRMQHASRVPAFRSASAFRSGRRCVAVASSSSSAAARTLPVPEKPAEQVAQAAAAIEAAWRAGIKRQRVELLLPLIGATDLDDWPGGVRQQFKAAQPLVEQILRVVKQVDGLQGPLQPEIWDNGDAVACYQSPKLAAVIFPTAATLDRLRKLAEGPNAPELVIIVNPQWESKAGPQSGANFLNPDDFGIGPWRAQKEALVATFTPTYWLRQQRVYGDIVRTLRAHPGPWQLHVSSPTQAASGAASECIQTSDNMPTYQQIEDALRARPESSINKSVAQRLQEEWEFNRKSLDNPPGGSR